MIFLVREKKLNPSSDYSPRDIFNIVEKSRIFEFAINIDGRTITVENRSDLFKLLSSFNLVSFKINGNDRLITDTEGVPVISRIDGRVKFKNSFDQTSPNYFYPVTATIGDKDRWTIRGSVSKSHPTR